MLVRRSLYVRSLTGVLQFGAGKRDSLRDGRSQDRDIKKIESIRINLRDLAWSQVFPRDPGILQPWIPGTRPGTTPGIPSKIYTTQVQLMFSCN